MMTIRRLSDGSMLIFADDIDPGERFLVAADLVATELHNSLFQLSCNESSGDSKNRCILSSLAVEEFFKCAGFKSKVQSVVCVIRGANWPGSPKSVKFGGSHTAILGDPNAQCGTGEWAGHLIALVEVEGNSFLVDTTLYNRIRPQWAELTGMVVISTRPDRLRLFQEQECCSYLGGYASTDGAWEISYYLNESNNVWASAPDTREEARWKAPAHALACKLQNLIES